MYLPDCTVSSQKTRILFVNGTLAIAGWRVPTSRPVCGTKILLALSAVPLRQLLRHLSRARSLNHLHRILLQFAIDERLLSGLFLKLRSRQLLEHSEEFGEIFLHYLNGAQLFCCVLYLFMYTYFFHHIRWLRLFLGRSVTYNRDENNKGFTVYSYVLENYQLRDIL
jgi:hypothetical protein